MNSSLLKPLLVHLRLLANITQGCQDVFKGQADNE